MIAVKRLLLVLLLLAGSLAARTAFFETRRERTYRRLIDQGEVALAAGNTSAAIEAFSGAVALKADSMLGYLRRGEAYRRRRRAGRRPSRPAAGLRARPHRPPSARAPWRRQRRAAPLRSRGRALPGLPRDRRPVAARALQAGARALPGRPAGRGDRRASKGARRSTRASPKRTTCSASASGDVHRNAEALGALTRAVDSDSGAPARARGARRALRTVWAASTSISRSSKRWRRSIRGRRAASRSGSPTREPA